MSLLPNETLHQILMHTVLEEIFIRRLAKSVWKIKAVESLERLRAVCIRWSNIIDSGFFQRQLYDTLNNTGNRSYYITENVAKET